MNVSESVDKFILSLGSICEEYSKDEDWAFLRSHIVDFIDELIILLTQYGIPQFSPKVILVYGGIKGNTMTTRRLVDNVVEKRMNSLFERLIESSKFESLLDWLTECRKGNKSICDRLIETIVVNMEGSHPANFFYRDAGLWLTFELCHPVLTQYTSGLICITLRAADSYVSCVAVAGVKALLHVAENSYTASLRYYGQADLIFDTLKKMLYTQDLLVLDAVVPCLVRLMNAHHAPPGTPASLTYDSHYRGQYDEVARIILQDLYITSSLARRMTLLRHIDRLTALLGTSMMKHWKLYIRAVESVLLAPECRGTAQPAKELIITNLSTVVCLVRPITGFVLFDILRSLIAFIDESCLFSNSSLNSDTLTSDISRIFDYLMYDHANQIRSVFENVELDLTNKSNFDFLRCKLRI